MRAKIVLRFEILPEEKHVLEFLCQSLDITKVEFLRRAIKQAIKDVSQS